MRFNELAWAGMLFYYRSFGDKRYSAVMGDRSFVERLRKAPAEISVREFEEKAILGLINVENYDLLVSHRLAEKLLCRVIEQRNCTMALERLSLVDCDLGDQDTMDAINSLYLALYVEGLWITGVSKIAHLLNERLLPPLNPDIAQRFGILSQKSDLTPWLRAVQQEIQEATRDFRIQGLGGMPEDFLSKKIGYSALGYTKSLVKFADEYHWIRYSDRLPLPPRWIPALS